MPRIDDIAYVRYRHPDLDLAQRFLTDFGLRMAARERDVLYLRGHGTWPYCYVAERGAAAYAGLALVAHSAQDLEALARGHGVDIEALRGPGGGRGVRLTDPEGLAIEVVHGIEPAPPLPLRAPLTVNFAHDKPRVNAFQRPPAGPAEVLRLGHVALNVQSIERTLPWYRDTLGLVPTDYITDPADDSPLAVFLHVDRGAESADHHTVLLARTAGSARVHHASFEVQDLDAVGMGGEHLTGQGWTRAWGIGRHLLGSQIFDYWRDPSGFIVEHYADGDLVTSAHQPGRYQAGPGTLAVWGPPVPERFLG